MLARIWRGVTSAEKADEYLDYLNRTGIPDYRATPRSEEHTSELQSLRHLVCRLLLEKKNKKHNKNIEKKENKINYITKYNTTHNITNEDILGNLYCNLYTNYMYSKR